jgi:hypothetical protein
MDGAPAKSILLGMEKRARLPGRADQTLGFTDILQPTPPYG